MKRSSLIILFLFCFSLSGLSKDVSLNQFMLDRWDNSNGLPQNSVTTMVQTRDGFIWMGTEEGFVKFDGIKFRLYDDSSLPLENHSTKFIFEDIKSPNIWVGTDGGGLLNLNYETEEFKIFDTRSGLPDNIINTGAQTDDGVFYAGTDKSGVAVIKPDGNISIIDRSQGLPDNKVKFIGRSNNSIWVASKNYLSKIEGTSVKKVATFPSEVTTVYFESQERFLIGTAGDGIFTFDPQSEDTGKFRSKVLSDKLISAISIDRHGCTFVGTYNDGFFRFCSRDDDKSNWLPNNYVVSIMEDTEGSIWFGTRGYGLYRVKEGKFITYGRKNGLAEAVVFPLTESRDGGMWLGTWAGAIYKLKDNKLSKITFGESLESFDTVLTLYQEKSANVLWAGVYGKGLLKITDNGAATKLYTDKDGLPDKMISAVFKDSKGILWIGTMSKGVAYMKDEIISAIANSDHMSVSAITEDQSGNIWIGTKRGPYKIQGESLIQDFTNLENISTLSIYPASDGKLIFASDNGLTVYEKSMGAITIDRKKGIDVRTIFDVIEDNNGNLWLTSNKGIKFIERKEFESFLDGSIPRVNPVTYGFKDGLLTPECNGGTQPNIWKASDGKIWIPTAEGAAVVDPSDIKTNAIVPPVHIVSVSANDKRFTSLNGDSIKLKPGTASVSFEFTGLSFLFPEQVKFKYMLEGLETKWNDAGTQRYTYYTNLDPGKYVFKVIAANNDNVWNKEGDSVVFVIEPFFWQTLWFKIIITLAFLAGLVFWINRKVTEVRNRENLLSRTIQSRTKNLRDIILHIKTLSDTLADISKTISGNTGITAEKFNATYAMIDTASSTLSDITAKLSETSESVQEMNRTLTRISGKADSSTVVLSDAVEAIERIESSANQVSNIVEVVDEIAFKTNLLSLNAAIEAARAGDAGKGFAVVAESVRELSVQTASAVETIQKLIDDAISKVSSGRSSVNNIVSFINELVSEFRSISHQIDQIRRVIELHVNEVGSVDHSLSDIRRITQESTTMVDGVYQVSRRLNAETANLRKEVAKIQDTENQ